MPINGADTKRLYESFMKGDTVFEGEAGPSGFVNSMQHAMGLREDEDGRRHIDLKARTLKPSRRLLEELAYAIVGPDAYEALRGAGKIGFDAALREDASSAVAPSAFMNISAWNVAAAGLLEVAVLESYQRADTIADQLCSTEPTKLRKNKFIGHTIIGNMAEGMNPGQRHPRAQFEERYVETPLTKKYGLAIEIMHEAVFFDLTSGGVISRAEDVGNELALLKERQIIDQFIGFNDTLNLNQYSYRGTAYDTYQGSSPWINTQANPLNDFDDVDDSEQLFVGMTDQEKGEPITITAKDILVMPAKYLRAKAILGFDTVQLNTQTDTVRGMGKNPLAGAGYNLIRANARLFNRIAAADGLNIGAANAAEYWFHGDFKGAFAWMENWGITTKRAAANDYQMADQDLVLAIFTNYMGTIATKEPRKIVRNTN